MKYGYKAFNKDLKCRGFQYEIGKVFETTDPVKLCASCFHYCEELKDVFEYYPKEKETRVCKILDLSDSSQKEGNKSCTNKLIVLEEVPNSILVLLTDNYRFNSGHYNSGHYNSGDGNSGNRNSGHYNSGHYNSGHYNSGDWNSGDWNSGDGNSGNRNSGHYNSGHYNSGHYNSGHYNSGNRNSGYGNSGNRNSGDWNSGRYNSGNYNSGYFNSTEDTVRLFNKNSKLKHNSDKIQKLDSIISLKWKDHLAWVPTSSMTEIEKENNSSHKTTGGFLRKTETSYRKSWEHVIEKCSKEEIKFIKSLPNFSSKVFFEITGVKI